MDDTRDTDERAARIYNIIQRLMNMSEICHSDSLPEYDVIVHCSLNLFSMSQDMVNIKKRDTPIGVD